MCLARVGGVFQPLLELLKALMEGHDVLFAPIFEVDEAIAGASLRCQQLIELELNREGVFVLRPLDKKNHQECDDSRACIDDELPGIGVMKNGSSYGPEHDDQRSQSEGPRAAAPGGDAPRETLEQLVDMERVVWLRRMIRGCW